MTRINRYVRPLHNRRSKPRQLDKKDTLTINYDLNMRRRNKYPLDIEETKRLYDKSLPRDSKSCPKWLFAYLNGRCTVTHHMLEHITQQAEKHST